MVSYVSEGVNGIRNIVTIQSVSQSCFGIYCTIFLKGNKTVFLLRSSSSFFLYVYEIFRILQKVRKAHKET